MDKKEIVVRYFAALREGANCSQETVVTAAVTAEDLYRELSEKHQFSLTSRNLKVAVNDSFESMDFKLVGGETVVFIPPVAGG